MSRLRTGLQIIVECVLLACALGIALDMVTAHVAVRYFTEFHPYIVESNSPVVMALVWGVIAAWWFGAIAGGVVAFVNARRRVPLAPQAIRTLMAKACAALWVTMMLILATAYSLIGLMPVNERKPTYEADRRLIAVAITHGSEYALGGIAAITIAILVWRRRMPEGPSL